MRNILLAIQHIFAMFGATVLVPYLTGMDISLALLTAGIGTLIFHLVTKKIIPVFLGSSFAFISAMLLINQSYGIAYVKGGLIITGCVYVVFAIFNYYIKNDIINYLLPPIVAGPIITVIGLRLIPVALEMSGYHDHQFEIKSLMIAILAGSIMLCISFISKSVLKFLPILISILICYPIAYIFNMVDLTGLANAPLIGLTKQSFNHLITMPKFDINAIFIIAPIALVTMIEHVGDLKTNSTIVGRNFLSSPGLHRTLLGDGLATIIAGTLGGPANTTYSENTGVLAMTKNYNPKILRLTALLAIILAFLGKITFLIQHIPLPIMGGISFVLFSLIASLGIKHLYSSNINTTNIEHFILPIVILSIGVFIDHIQLINFEISGILIATIIGILANQLVIYIKQYITAY